MLDDQQCNGTYEEVPTTAQASVNCTLQVAQWEAPNNVNNKGENRRRSVGYVPGGKSHSENNLRFIFVQKFKKPRFDKLIRAASITGITNSKCCTNST